MISIRKASKSDAPAAWKIRREAILTFCSGHYPEKFLATWTEGKTPESFPAMLEKDFYLAVVDGKTAGTGMVDLESGKIDGIFVDPGNARTGVGRAIMPHLETIAREAGLDRLHLESTLNAAEFYRTCGFSGNTVASYQSRRGISLDCIPMMKNLRESRIQLRPMRTADLGEVAALGIRSKASWGYSPEEMEIFSRELTLEVEDLDSLQDARVAILNGELVGYVTLRRHPDGKLELDHLFVSPDRFRRGIGAELLRAALESARLAGAKTVMLIADPNSAGFYTRHGAKVIGEHQSSIAGRTIPILSMPTRDSR